jgi:hypothetical protein
MHWITAGAVLYLAAVGINEFLPTGTVAFLDGLPDAGALISTANSNGSSYTAGAIDIGVAAGLYFLVLHKKLF